MASLDLMPRFDRCERCEQTAGILKQGALSWDTVESAPKVLAGSAVLARFRYGVTPAEVTFNGVLLRSGT